MLVDVTTNAFVGIWSYLVVRHSRGGYRFRHLGGSIIGTCVQGSVTLRAHGWCSSIHTVIDAIFKADDEQNLDRSLVRNVNASLLCYDIIEFHCHSNI